MQAEEEWQTLERRSRGGGLVSWLSSQDKLQDDKYKIIDDRFADCLRGKGL